MKDLKDMTVGELRSRTSEQTGIGMELLKCREGFDELTRRLSEAERKLAEAEERARHWEETCHSQHEDTVEPLRASLAKAEGIIAEATALSGAEPGNLLIRIIRMKDLLIQQQKEISALRERLSTQNTGPVE